MDTDVLVGDVLDISEKDLFQLFNKVDNLKQALPGMKQASSIEDYLNKIKEEVGEKLDCKFDIIGDISPTLKKFRKTKSKKLSITRILENASDEIVLQIHPLTDHSNENAEPPKKKCRGPQVFSATFSKSYKDFIHMSDRQKKNVTDPLIHLMEQFIRVNEFSLNICQLLEYLLSRQHIERNLQCQASFSTFEAVALMHYLVLSKEQTRKVRQFLSNKNIHFPTTNSLIPLRKSLRPDTSSILNDKGRAADFTETVAMTANSILRVVSETKTDFSPSNGQLTFYFKDGGDGAGTMPTLKSKEEVDSPQNIFQYGLTPLRLTQNVGGADIHVWQNKVPNSGHTLRPIFLVREKENNDDLLKHVIPQTDAARKKLNDNGLKIIFENTEINCKCVIKDTMKDIKYKKVISGLGGADCLLCKSKAKDWTDPEKVKQEFKIDRTAEDTRAIFLSVIDENGEINIKPDDFGIRSGVTQEPISNSDQHCITITHSYINGCNWFMKLLYRCHADYPQWIEHQGYKKVLEHSKDVVREAIKEKTGLCLGFVCSAGGKGGTSTDGKQARRFFSDETVPVLKELLSKSNNKKHQDNVIILHKQLSIILRVISCTRMIDTEKFAEHCQQTMETIATKFKWARLCDTLHGSIQHSAELIEMNGGLSLGWYSEEGLEANNKDIRNYLEHLSRKCDSNSQISDVHHRLLERSDPYLLHIASLSMKSMICKICGSMDHTIRTHEKKHLRDVDGIEDFFLIDQQQSIAHEE